MRKSLLTTLMCLAAMMSVYTSLKAQEVTVVLMPGWNWISVPSTDTLDFATALESFTPAVGDIIQSQWGSASYLANGHWRGTISQFFPGYGYMYKSIRTEPITMTFQMQQTISQVVVTTLEPTDITAATAIVGGTVAIDEGNHIYVYGICYDTVQMPTMDGSHTFDFTATSDFTFTLTKLIPNTTYYVRAYVVTDYGLTFGEEHSFITLDNSGSGEVPEGAINGLFTINASGEQVYFSQGNLQYNAVDSLWRFAENQYDYIGNANSNISQFYNGWIDLFGWGTSGYDHGANCYQPWSTSSNYSDYYAYGIWNNNLNDQSGLADWGYNAILNGGNQENYWRTLSQSEWDYVLFTRNTTSDIRLAKATVNGVHGIVLLPDSWNESAYELNDANLIGAPYETNMIADSTWESLEALGVVFLPASGYRYELNTNYLNSYGYYWSSTYADSRYAYSMTFSDNWVYSDNDFYRYFGRSVRLVRNAE